MADNSEIKITFQTLFEILQTEKKRDELQKLDGEYYQNVIDYINEKKKASEKSTDDSSKKQYDNALRMIKEIYDWREKKITEMARSKARMELETKQVIIDTSALLPEEKSIYERLCTVYLQYRKNNLINMLAGRTEEKAQSPANPSTKTPANSSSIPLAGTSSHSVHSAAEADDVKGEVKGASIGAAIGESRIAKQSKDNKLVRFIASVQRFAGRQLESYGPFEPEDMASMPADLADILIRKGKAEEIKQE